MKLLKDGLTIATASAKADMDEKTARKYMGIRKMPSEVCKPHTWRTREDAFEEVWPTIEPAIEEHEWFEATEVLRYLQQQYPGRFHDGQVRTLQRRMREFRATKGKAKEVMFPQIHFPGRMSESDFTSMNDLGVLIGGELFMHLLYHFVLTYSNCESVTIVMSESLESLAKGLQNALFEIGGVPEIHQIDRMGAAVLKPVQGEEFTWRYQALLDHLGMKGQKIQTGKANENGDVEQSHHRFKNAVRHALVFRGSKEFASREEYESFLRDMVKKRNHGRAEKFLEEAATLRPLPATRYLEHRTLDLRIGPSSSIIISENTYSVDSRLKGHVVEARVHAEHIEVWLGNKKVDEFPRLRGKKKHKIQYRHIIASLVRKPGAFENYRYRDDLFPTSHFRIAYDSLRQTRGKGASGEYLKILELAATVNESFVDEALRKLIDSNASISFKDVKALVVASDTPVERTDVFIEPVEVSQYDSLLSYETFFTPSAAAEALALDGSSEVMC
jgi:hypothetical protein